MFGLDQFAILIFASAASEGFVVYDWKEQCKDIDIDDWKIKGNARSEPERSQPNCWATL